MILRYIVLFLNGNICYDPSLEPSRRDGFNDVSQHMFNAQYENFSQNHPSYSFLSGALFSVFTDAGLRIVNRIGVGDIKRY